MCSSDLTHVNTYIQFGQEKPSITAFNEGGYIVAWQSYGQDGSSVGVYLQRFDGGGEKVGSETQVNTYIESWQFSPSITALNDGGYVITWESREQDGSGTGVYLQRFDNNGERVGEETQVNTYTQNFQRSPDITALNDGGFIITWESEGQDYSDSDIYIQRFDGDGNKVDTSNNIIHGGRSNDILIGGDTKDTIYAYGGSDTLVGNLGDDTLYGGLGNDIYEFGRNDKHDIINDEGSRFNGTFYDFNSGVYVDYYGDFNFANGDILRFKEGITKDDLIIHTDGDKIGRAHV